jgi:hypothetical protein
MRTQNPETMTPAERDAEVASILALGLARVGGERSIGTKRQSRLPIRRENAVLVQAVSSLALLSGSGKPPVSGNLDSS